MTGALLSQWSVISLETMTGLKHQQVSQTWFTQWSMWQITHCKEAIYVMQCETCMTGNDYGDPPSATGSIIFSLQMWNTLNLRNCSKILMWTTVEIGTFMKLYGFHASQAGNPSEVGNILNGQNAC
jgi:hypothetical protein